MGSSRLPNKILLPFCNDKCILDLLICKLRQIPNAEIIVATSVSSNNDIIEQFCNKNDISCYRGSESDVIQRFVEAAESYNAEKIIRVCSDNPFLELDAIKKLADTARHSLAEYISFNINGTPSIKTHYGFWTEYTTLSALKKVTQATEDPLYHEHVTNYIYTHPDEFRIEWIPGPECLNGRNDIRLTCDTKEDFQNSKEIYNDLCKDDPYPSIETLVDYLNNHAEYLTKMKQQINRNAK